VFGDERLIFSTDEYLTRLGGQPGRMFLAGPAG
jgi:hypothetical protein